MITSLGEWLSYLKDSGSMVGLPLIIAGAGLMMFGWRLWRFCVALAYGLIGAGAVAMFTESGPQQVWLALGCGLIAAIVSYWPAHHALALLGGMLGAWVSSSALEGMGLTGPPQWIACGVALIACGGVAFLNRQLVVIGVTAFLGASLVMSGLAALLMSNPSLYNTFYSMARGSVLMVSFMLLVPTTMSAFYQMAEVKRLNAEL